MGIIYSPKAKPELRCTGCGKLWGDHINNKSAPYCQHDTVETPLLPAPRKEIGK